MNDADAQLLRLELQRDTLLDRVDNGFFQHFTTTPEERHDTYKRMGLRVEVDREGEVTINGSVLPDDMFVSQESRRPPAPRRKLLPPR
jgi:hypothetical protein